MPQDKRRSRSYRSFVTCDDPKGIVECGATIRKPKISSSSQKKEQKSCSSSNSNNNKVEFEKKLENYQNPANLSDMGFKGITRELQSPASFQLLEVSKGAEKLNHVINSWSNSNGKGGQQKHIAKDLLKGALDLQDSLVMLTKLQEAKSYMMSGSTKKKKEKQKKLEEGRFDGMVKGLMDSSSSSNRFGYLEEDEEKPRHRHSVDGSSSRKSFDEMRQVVRHSLLRQNVITNPIYEEHSFGHRKLICSPDHDMPSTSSSQSSMIHSSNFAPSDSSFSSSTVSQRKKNGKGSNLLVKLMGLESLPSSPKMMNLTKPMYDIDSPRARKTLFGAQELGTKQRTVDEILETLKFKGLLRNNSGDGRMMPDSPPCSEEEFLSVNRWFDERPPPPIVVMKPMCFPYLDVEQPYMPRSKEQVMKSRSRRGPSQETVSCDTGTFSWKCKGVEPRADFEEKVKSWKKNTSVNLQQKPQKKQTVVRKESEVVKVTNTRRKVEEMKVLNSSHELGSRDRAYLSTSNVKRRKDGMIISKNQTSSPQKTILDHRMRETSESPRQREKNRQPASIGEFQRHKGLSKDRKATATEESDSASENGSVSYPTVDAMIMDIHSHKRAEASQIQITDYDIDDQSSLSDMVEGFAYLNDDKKIPLCDLALTRTHDHLHHPDDDQSSHSDITSISISVGHLDESQSPLHEVTSITTTLEIGGSVLLDTDCETPENCITPRTKLKAMLLSSPSFVSRAEELFDLQVNSYIVSHRSDPDEASNRVLLDCANEVMELTSLQYSRHCLPLPRIYTINQPQHSLSDQDQLLEEICNKIEDLQSHDKISSDNLYLVLDRDLRCKSSTWEMGWRNGFSQDEVDRVVMEVDKLILGELIEEVVADFML